MNLHENIFDAFELADGQIDGQIESVMWQSIDGTQCISEAGMRHIAPFAVILFDQLRTLVDQIEPLR